MIKVEFKSTFESSISFNLVCKKLGLSYRRDPDYKQHFFGCSAPDTGYIVDTDDFQSIKKLAVRELFVESLKTY
jgi:hypothetical protein